MRIGTSAHLRKLAIVAVLASSMPFAVHASMVSYLLDQSNTTPPFPDGTNYLLVTLRDGIDAAGVSINSHTTTASDVLFSVTVLPSLTQYRASGFGIDEFALNTVLTSAPTSANFVLPTNWSLQGLGNADGFGKFELHTDTNGANNRLSTLVFAIKDVSSDSVLSYYELASGNAAQGQYAYAAHVAGMSAPNGDSAWFAGSTPAPVPLPASAPLLLSALGGVSVLARRARVRRGG